MKKSFIVFAIIVGVLFVSCAKKSTEQATSKSAAQSTVQGLSFAESTTMNMIGWRFPITEFYAESLETLGVPNLTVNTQMLDSDGAREQVRLALAGGQESPYDIVQGDTAFLTELASKKQVLPLNKYIEKYKDQYDLGDIDNSLYTLGSPDGKIYGIPITSNTMIFFYNMEIYEKYGLQVPGTYEEVLSNAKALLDAGADIDLPFLINLHAGWAWRVEFINFLGGFGGKLLDSEGMPTFNGSEGVAAIELMLEIVDNTMGDKGLTWSIDDAEIGLETGRLASATTWASRAANMDDPTKSQYVGKIGFAPAPRVSPSGKRPSIGFADFYMIPANTKNDPEKIFEVIAKVSDLEHQELGADLSLMTRQKISNKRTDIRYTKASLESISQGGNPTSTHPASSILQAMLDNNLSKVLDRRDDIQGVLDEIAQEYQQEAQQQGLIQGV